MVFKFDLWMGFCGLVNFYYSVGMIIGINCDENVDFYFYFFCICFMLEFWYGFISF